MKIDYNKFKIDLKELPIIDALVKERQNFNPGCQSISYWSERMDRKIRERLVVGLDLPYGYVGDGWPQKSDQQRALEFDRKNLARFFSHIDCRDIGDSIYQCNTLIDYLERTKNAKMKRVLDFGSGYGRLALPFIQYFSIDHREFSYIGVDYVSLSLLIAPQFVQQMIGCGVGYWKDIVEGLDSNAFEFLSLPAWEIDKLDKVKFDLFITVHSFQEMTRGAVDFYVDWADRHAVEEAIFYSINIDPKDRYVPNRWELLFDRPFPVNRDGHYNEKLWRIK